MNGWPSSTASNRPGTPVTCADAAGDRRGVDPEDARGLDRSEDVLDVEASAKPRLDCDAVDGEARTACGEVEALGIPEGEGDRLLPELAQFVGQAAAVVVVDVHDGGRSAAVRVGLREEAPLGIVVVLQRPVKVEMVLAQVREDEARQSGRRAGA